MENTIKTYLLNQAENGILSIEDLATFGVPNVAPQGLISNHDTLEFFSTHEREIKDTVRDYLENLGHESANPFTDIQAYDLLRNNVVQFSDMDTVLDLMRESALKDLELDYTEQELADMGEDEYDDLLTDYMNDIDPLPTDQDKIYFVWLAVEIVASEIIGE